MANFLIESEPDAAYKDQATADAAATARRTAMAAAALTNVYGPQAADPTLWQGALSADRYSQETPDAVTQFHDQTTDANLKTGQLGRADDQQQQLAVLGAAIRMSKGDPDNGVAPMSGADVVKALAPHLGALGVDQAHFDGLAGMIQNDPQGTYQKLYEGITGSATPPTPEDPGAKMQGKVIYTTDAQGAQHAGYIGADGKWREVETPAGTKFIADPDTQLNAQTKSDIATGKLAGAGAGGSAIPPDEMRAGLTAAAQKYVPNDPVFAKLAFAVANNESKFNPGVAPHTSPHGTVVGGMQLLESTAKSLGKDPYDPAQNIDGGVQYLAQLYQHFGHNPAKTLAAYNAGPTNVDNAGGVPNIPETQAYVSKGMAYMQSPDIGDAMTGGDAVRGAAPGPYSARQAVLYGDQLNKLGKMPAGVTGYGQAGQAARMQITQTAANRLSMAGITGGQEQQNAQVFNKENAGLLASLGSNKPNDAGGQISGLGTVIDHLTMFGAAAGALGNHNVQVFNQLSQMWNQQTGSPLPSNFAAQKALAIAEVDRVTTGGNPTVQGRADLKAAISQASSPAQLMGAINSFRDFAAARLNNVRARYTGAGLGPQFDAQLAPRTRVVLDRIAAGSAGGPGFGIDSTAAPPNPNAGFKVLRVNGG